MSPGGARTGDRPFRDRGHAGRLLAARLAHLASTDPVVVGLPRGGVPVAAEVAGALDAPLDVVVVRKLGLPWQPEVAMGALGEGGIRVLDQAWRRRAGVTDEDVEDVVARESRVLDQRVRAYRGADAPIEVRGRTVVLVDDGMATGSTARAAVQVLRQRGAAEIVVAVPVASTSAVRALRRAADDVVCLATPRPFLAVGSSYLDFGQASDDEVARLLRARRPGTA